MLHNLHMENERHHEAWEEYEEPIPESLMPEKSFSERADDFLFALPQFIEYIKNPII